MKNMIALAIVTILLFTVLSNGLAGPTFVEAETSESNALKSGVNYLSTYVHYESGYLSDEELDRDFTLFNDHDLTYITLTAVWKYLEPRIGEYNEDALDDLIRDCSFADRHNLRVIINFYTMMGNDSWTMPSWLSPHRFEAVFTNSTAKPGSAFSITALRG